MSQDYESSVSKRFALAVEQLEQCAELIEVGGIPKFRMAVVLMDNLADTFLYRRCLSHIVRAHQQTFDISKKVRITKRELEKLKTFPAKLDFIQRIESLQDHGGSRLARADVDLLSIGHNYRNAIYHRDSHNPSVIPVLVRLLYAATCRLLPMSTGSLDWTVYSESTQRDLVSLKRYTVIDSDGGFSPHKAAVAVASVLQERITQNPERAIVTLSSDLQTRCEQLTELADRLPAVERVLPWAEFWELHGYDHLLVRLADRGDSWLRFSELMANKQAVWTDMNEAEEQLNARVKQLWLSFKPEVSLQEIGRATKVAHALRTVDDIAMALRAYHEVDRRLSRLEGFLWEIETEYDRMADLEYDSWRESQ